MDFPGGRRSESLTSLTTSPLWSYILLLFSILKFMVFPGGSHGKESSCNAGDLGSILGSGKSPGEGNGYPFQHSCLGNPMDRRAWWVTGVTGLLILLLSLSIMFYHRSPVICSTSLFPACLCLQHLIKLLSVP